MLPYLDESTPPSDYLPTKRAQYKVFHKDSVATVTIDQNDGGFTSVGVALWNFTLKLTNGFQCFFVNLTAESKSCHF